MRDGDFPNLDRDDGAFCIIDATMLIHTFDLGVLYFSTPSRISGEMNDHVKAG